MSLYNMIHGVNPLASVLLTILDIEYNDIPRFRDCYFDGENIVIYTRTGGGNREYYESLESRLECDYEVDMGGPFNEDLLEIQGYLRDEDDSYDCTYASFYYEVPEKFKYLLGKLKSMAMKETQEERWENAIERIKTANADDPLVSKVTEAFKPLFEQITKATEQE